VIIRISLAFFSVAVFIVILANSFIPQTLANLRHHAFQSASLLLLGAFGLLFMSGLIGAIAAGAANLLAYFSKLSRLQRRLYFLQNKQAQLQRISVLKLAHVYYLQKMRLKRLQEDREFYKTP
jgi:uncharacterized membrane protein (DUF106 family)